MTYYQSPVDGHDHFTEQGRHGCQVCALETERDQLRADLEFAEGEFARENRRAVDLKIERDHYHRFAMMVGDIVRLVPEDVPSIDIETLLRDLPANIAAIKNERDRLRAVADAAHTLVEALDANPIGEYGDAACEAIDVLDAKLKATKEGT